MDNKKEIMAIMLMFAKMYKAAQASNSQEYYLMVKDVGQMYNKMYLNKFKEAIINVEK